MVTSYRTFDITCIRTNDRNHLITMCQFVSMFTKARCARRKQQKIKAIRQCRQWRERPASYKKSQNVRWAEAKLPGRNSQSAPSRNLQLGLLVASYVLLSPALLIAHRTGAGRTNDDYF